MAETEQYGCVVNNIALIIFNVCLYLQLFSLCLCMFVCALEFGHRRIAWKSTKGTDRWNFVN